MCCWNVCFPHPLLSLFFSSHHSAYSQSFSSAIWLPAFPPLPCLPSSLPPSLPLFLSPERLTFKFPWGQRWQRFIQPLSVPILPPQPLTSCLLLPAPSVLLFPLPFQISSISPHFCCVLSLVHCSCSLCLLLSACLPLRPHPWFSFNSSLRCYDVSPSLYWWVNPPL